MKRRFNLKHELILTAPLVCILALPTAATPQTPDASHASLQDTLNWLVSFLPTATGGSVSIPNRHNHKKHATLTDTTTLSKWNGCKVSFTSNGNWAYPDGSTMKEVDTAEFSLSDITPASIKIVDEPPDSWTGDYIVLSLSSETESIHFFHTIVSGGGEEKMQSAIAFGYFHDRARAEQAADAMRHATVLCAKPRPA
jgi:hypothetical protein